MKHPGQIIFILAAGFFMLNLYGTEKASVHWDFDAISEQVLKDSAGGSHGTAAGILDDFIRPGLYGNAACFNSGKNFVEVNFSESLSLTDNFTMEMVIMPFKVTGLNTIIWKGNRQRVPQQINYWMEINKGRFCLKYKDQKDNWIIYYTREIIEPGQWHDIILVRKGGMFSLWVNFTPQQFKCASRNASAIAPLADRGKITIGGGDTGTERLYSFDGLIDDIKIYPGEVIDISPARQLDWEHRRLEYVRREIQRNADAVRRSMDEYSKSARSKLPAEGSTTLKDAGQLVLAAAQLEKQLQSNAEKADIAELTRLRKRLESDVASWRSVVENVRAQVQLQTDSLDYQTYFRENAGTDKDFLVTTMQTARRLLRKTDFFRKLGSPVPVMNLSLARNERESCQVLLLGNPERDLAKVKVEVGNLRHENGSDMIPADSIEWGWIKDITTRTPNIYVEFTGKIPDPVIEGIDSVDVAKADFTPLLFRFHADKNTRPGNYSGSIKIIGGKQTSTVNVRLKVYAFTLPEQVPLRVAFYFYERFYANWYGLKNISPEQWDKIYAFLFKYRLQPSNFYSYQPCWPPLADIDKYRNCGVNFTTLKHVSLKSWSEDQIKGKLNDWRTIIAKLKQDKFYPDNTYIKLYDELSANMDKFEAAKQIMPRLRSEFPELKCVQTSFPDEKIRPYYNVWCPLMSYFADADNLKLFRSIQNTQGQELWWYLADGPSHPMPNLFLDYPVFDCRIVMTMSYMYKIKGIIYWSINREWTENMGDKRWPDIPWKPYITNVTSQKTIYKNGMGNMIYPGPGGKIYPSLRLENLRDGIEDYLYLNLLEQKLTALKRKGSGRKELIAAAEKLLTVPPEVATAVDSYSSDPENLLNYRRKLAEVLEQMD